MTEDSIKESQYEAARREREETEKLAVEEDTAKEILGWIFEATVTFLSIFLITAVLLSFFGILEFSIN